MNTTEITKAPALKLARRFNGLNRGLTDQTPPARLHRNLEEMRAITDELTRRGVRYQYTSPFGNIQITTTDLRDPARTVPADDPTAAAAVDLDADPRVTAEDE